MQVGINSFMRENPLAYQTAQKQQKNTASFDMLLSIQTNTNNIGEGQEEQEKTQTYGDIYSDLFQQCVNGEIDEDTWRSATAASFTASLVEAYQKYGWNGDLFSKMKGVHQERIKADTPDEITTEIHKDIFALNHNVIWGGTSSGISQHAFETEKNKAIDILSEILQEIKA